MKNNFYSLAHKFLALILTLSSVLFSSPAVLANSQPNSLPTQNISSATTKAANSSPITFVENKGQFDKNIFFSTIKSPVQVDFEQNGITQTLPNSGQTIKTTFSNPDHQVIPVSQNPTGGLASYYPGNDHSKWVTEAKMYNKITYSNVWEGIDVVYEIEGSNVKYSFIASPNADISKINLSFEGLDSISVNNDNQLILHTPSEQVTDQNLKVYQTINNSEKAIASSFNIQGNNVSFNISDYDHNSPLIIDPTLVYSSFYGNTGVDEALGTTVDADGNSYITGYYTKTTGATGLGSFIERLSPGGVITLYVYLPLVGSNPAVQGGVKSFGIALDSSKNIYITGETNSPNLPTLVGPRLTQIASGMDFFVGKYDPNGNMLYQGYVDDGAATQSYGRSIAVDPSGNAYITGYEGTSASDLNMNAKTYKINPTGSTVLYSFSFSGFGTSAEKAFGIAVDNTGSAYIAGSTNASSGIATAGAFDTSFGGIRDGFYCKINTTGTGCVYSSYVGGDGLDEAFGVALDPSQSNLYIIGDANNTTHFTYPLGGLTANYTHPGFIVRVSPSTGSVILTRFVAENIGVVSAGIATPYAVAADNQNQVFITGKATFFPFLAGPYQNAQGANDVFLQKLDSNFNVLSSGLFGSTGDDAGLGIGVSSNNALKTVTIVGNTTASNFPLLGDTAAVTGYQGATDGFITRVSTYADNVGIFRPSNGLIYQKFQNYGTGFADNQITFGIPGDQPIAGDWDGNGTHTIGVYRGNVFYLRNTNTTGFADIVSTGFGQAGDIPVAGDWNGDGTDTVGLFRPSSATFILSNNNFNPTADYVASLGVPGDLPIIGDWNGDGTDTIGVFRPSNGQIYLRNSNTTGFADVDMVYGIAGDQPLSGDWDGDGVDTIGVLRGNTFLLRNTNSTGNADISFALGNPGDIPIAGNWVGRY